MHPMGLQNINKHKEEEEEHTCNIDDTPVYSIKDHQSQDPKPILWSQLCTMPSVDILVPD